MAACSPACPLPPGRKLDFDVYVVVCGVDNLPCISIDPQVRSEKPCVKGTRITEGDVLDYLGGSMMVLEVLDNFPDLTAEVKN